MVMIKEIKKIVFKLCKGQEDIWENHIISVVNYSKRLAKKRGADKEIVEIAAWLHDIKKLRGEKGGHHIFGAKEAEQILKKIGYPHDKTEQVKECILTHSSDKKYPPKSLEAKIVATADALSIFDNFPGMAYVAYSRKGLPIKGGREWLIKKYKTAWNKLIPKGREIAKQKYEAIKLLLGKQN